MNEHVAEFFSEFSLGNSKGNFHKVIPLHDSIDFDWNTAKKKFPDLPKGWFELCELPKKDRIQFSLEFWLMKFPYHPSLTEFLSHFFALLDDVGVFLTQKTAGKPFIPYMVYSLTEDRCFYRGAPPASDDDILNLQKSFSECILPKDYTSFLQIHNGFWKATDETGIVSSANMERQMETFQQLLLSKPQLTTVKGRPVNPASLIPFYESFGMPYFQCFWTEWFPEKEMGNVYYSSALNTISDEDDENLTSTENMSFPTFSDWLMFYLEQVI